MTTLDDKFKPQEGPLPAVPESEDEPPRGVRCGNPALRELWDLPKPPDLNLRERRPATDWLAVFGVGAAVIAFLLWAWPESYEPGNFSRSLFFEAERLPAVAVFLALSLILLLLRRR